MPLRKSSLRVIHLMIAMLLAAAVMVSAAGCAESTNRINLEDCESFDIIQCIDADSIERDGDVTYFNAVLEDGTTVRFEDRGVNVSAGAIKFTPDSEITSLDAVGAIVAYRVHVSENLHEENGVGVGGGYTFSSETSVSSADQLINMEKHIEIVSIDDGTAVIRITAQ